MGCLLELVSEGTVTSTIITHQVAFWLRPIGDNNQVQDAAAGLSLPQIRDRQPITGVMPGRAGFGVY